MILDPIVTGHNRYGFFRVSNDVLPHALQLFLWSHAGEKKAGSKRREAWGTMELSRFILIA
jgi:hypothetical protein